MCGMETVVSGSMYSLQGRIQDLEIGGPWSENIA
jgi:hypothetical protein